MLKPSVSTQNSTEGGLARNAIGLREVVFQSTAFMGPAATLVSSLPLVMAYAGGAAVSACLLALMIMLLVALSIAQLAKKLPSAGSFATYAAHGIGPRTGFIVGWIYLLLTLTMAPLLILILSSVLSDATHTGSLWWLWALAGTALVIAVNVRGVKASSRLNVALGAFEVLVIAVLSVWLIIKAGHLNTLSVFGTSLATVPGHVGFAGIVAGAAYCVLAFSGFESAAPLAEETRDARRNIPRAVVFSLLVIAALEIVAVYAGTVAYGPKRAYAFSQIGGALGQGWQDLARTLFPLGAALIVLVVLNSCLANANAGVNSSTRTLFALGRVQLLPVALARVNPKWNSPVVAVIVQAIVGTAVTLGLGFAYGPATAFGIVGTGITLLFVLLYMSVHVSCFFFFKRHHAADRTVISHYLVPALGFLLLVPELFVASGIKIFSFISPITAPFSYGAYAALLWIPIGMVHLWLTARKHPERVGAMTAGIAAAAE